MEQLLIAAVEKLLFSAISNGPDLLQKGEAIGKLAVGIVTNIKNDNPDFTALHAQIDALASELDAPLPADDGA